jgi:multisubunit Na+/H+ antiporter MnhF subunit
MNVPPPSQWPGKTLGAAVTVLLAAIALYVSARLVLDVAPVLIIIGTIAVVLYVVRTVHQHHRGGW